VKVLVLTTSYPPDGGSFVAALVDAARSRGIEVEVVSPASFRHFGIAGGHGIVANLRARPWLALFVPALLWNMRRAAARTDAELVHAHWLPAGLVAATLRKPYLVQPWGTDVALLGRLPWRFRNVVAASPFLAGELGGGRVVPTPVPFPDRVVEPDDPPHALFAGRLSPEKGIAEFLAATEGLPRVVVGGGPVDVPEGLGPVNDVGPFYDRAAVVVVPSRREGYGMVAREAMAHGRAVVATAVGGLRDAIEDGVDGLLVPPGDLPALRAAVERLLGDRELRERLGAAARAKAEHEWSAEAAASALQNAYSAVQYDGRR
jgi:glycosyltransferase involved in cell wall biosynthesis